MGLPDPLCRLTPRSTRTRTAVNHPMTFSVRAAKPEEAEAACCAVRAYIEVCCTEDHGGDGARLDAWLKNKTPETFRTWIQSDKLYSVVVEESSRIVGFGMSAPGEVLLWKATRCPNQSWQTLSPRGCLAASRTPHLMSHLRPRSTRPTTAGNP